MDTICACATALPAHTAVLRLSGPTASAVAVAAGLELPSAWGVSHQEWDLGPGPCPCRVLFAPAGRSYSGFDLVEVFLPGSPDLVELALERLRAAGAEAAGPGAFTRQAVATGRMTLDRAAAVLALSQAGDAAAARRAVTELRGGLGAALEPVRQRLLQLRALVEAGLDFIDEEDVRAYDPQALVAELGELRATIAAWHRAADELVGEPLVCLAGPANAGKSALFAALTGEQALVSEQAGTTRDWLQGSWDCGGRRLRLVDTAGWLDARLSDEDDAAVAAGRERLAAADLILLCAAPDAPLAADAEAVPALADRAVVVATKADLGAPDPRSVVAVSVHSGLGLEQLAGLVASRLAAAAGSDPRQARLLDEAITILDRLVAGLPEDLLLAEELAACCTALGELLGATTSDEVLGAIFSRFCIGK